MLRGQTWVLTGAAGRIATDLRPHLAEQVGRLRLVDVVPVAAEYDGEEAIVADLRDPEATRAAIARADGVLHLGGLADEANLHDLVDVNIAGTFHALEAARRTGVKRFIYASSNRVTGMYPVTTTVNPDMPPRPDGLYGVSKIAGEALARMYAEKFGLSVIAVRIGSAEDTPQDVRQLSTWLSPGDCRAAFLAAMRARDVSYAAFYAVSRNRRRWWDLTAGSRLGFHPADDAERYADRIETHPLSPLVRQGGAYATETYTLRWLEPTVDAGRSSTADRRSLAIGPR
jgi:uronate dehydrogenase